LTGTRDHGGNLDAAISRHGGNREGWIDLSTGINPVPYPIPNLPDGVWSALPDADEQSALERAARAHWTIPEDAALLAAPGASALIAKLPGLRPPGRVHIPAPTYNEHAAAFAAHGWTESDEAPDARVIVHPNNPTGHWYTRDDLTAPFTVIDESFADVAPGRSLTGNAARPGIVVIKSFGKFWGLAGLRLGFAIGPPDLIGPLATMLGPWPVSGPALRIGAVALADDEWSKSTRTRLNEDAARLDVLMGRAGARCTGGTSLFRLYDVTDAGAWQERLARHHVWTRIFPWSDSLIRLGLPAPGDWARLEAAI